MMQTELEAHILATPKMIYADKHIEPVLAELAVNHPVAFSRLGEIAKPGGL